MGNMTKERKTITFHLDPKADKDLIALMDEVTGKERAELIKSRLRGETFIPLKSAPDYRPAIEDILVRVHWVQENIYALPKTIEDLISQLNLSRPVTSLPSDSMTEQERATKEALERRKEKTKKNGW